ncbi:type III pantothenate kinase [Alicyclobacillaceae bacterium I2511]|nr:type III pantothenate kinase [Alicyclobacillaceae bacterium I2511]
MDTILVIDVGNTNIVLGIYEGQTLRHHWRIATVQERTVDEYGILLKQLFQDRDFVPHHLQGVVLSSVVPPLMTTLEETCQTYFGLSPLVVGAGLDTGLVIDYDNPQEVGADRIVNAVAGVAMYGPPLIIVDFGTATTFCVIDEKGHYKGGVIAPGIQISTNALFQRASKLPRIDLVRPSSVVGHNTVASMQSGVIFGFVGQVDGIVERIQAEVPLPFQVIATGGLSRLMRGESHTIQHFEPNLTLEGLRILWQQNRPEQVPAGGLGFVDS